MCKLQHICNTLSVPWIIVVVVYVVVLNVFVVFVVVNIVFIVLLLLCFMIVGSRVYTRIRK